MGYECHESSDQCVAMPICYENILVKPDGNHDDCWPYRCVEGECLESCQSTADCVSGYSCASSGDCVDASALAPVESDSSCSSSGAGRTPWRASVLLLGWLALGWAGRRRLRRRLRP